MSDIAAIKNEVLRLKARCARLRAQQLLSSNPDPVSHQWLAARYLVLKADFLLEQSSRAFPLPEQNADPTGSSSALGPGASHAFE